MNVDHTVNVDETENYFVIFPFDFFIDPAPLALPAPPHGRASMPPPGERKRVFHPAVRDPGSGRPDNVYTVPPVLTKNPMVVMDKEDRNR